MQLANFARNLYSQHGEDGIIEQILEWTKLPKGLCVEFGAWDGYRFSNTANLWTNGWPAVLLESDAAKYQVLIRNAAHYEGVRAIHEMVGLDPGKLWQDLVGEGAEEAAIVSIDVDGNDYWLFKESPYGPALYIVEYNTTLPAWLDIYTPYAPDNYFGCSLKALCRLAEEKGYRYIGSTRSNGFFLRMDLMAKIPLELDRDLHHAANNNDLVYLMTSFAGDFAATGVGPYGRTHAYTKPILRG